MKILHAIRQGEFGGGETHVMDLVKGMQYSFYESFVVAFSEGQMVEELRLMGVPVFVIHTKSPFDISVWQKVGQIIKDNNINILHAHGTRAFSNTFYSAKRLSIPVIYTVHGWSFHADQNKIVRWFRKKSEGFLISKANTTVFVSEANSKEGKTYYGNFNSVIIRNGIDHTKFNVDGLQGKLREELSVSDNTFLLGFIARITKQKNLISLLNAIALLPKEYDIKLIIAGDGDLKEEMEKKTKELDIADKTIFLNYRSDIRNILNSIDVYCLPSLWEGLSIGLLEAMSMRKAVIVSDIETNTEVVKHMYNGFVSRPSAEELGAGISTLYKSRALREKLATNAYKTILEEFQLEMMVEKVKSVYSALNNRKEHIDTEHIDSRKTIAL